MNSGPSSSAGNDKLNHLVPSAEALEIVLSGALPCEPETVPLSQAANRVLAEDLAARRTQPPFDASAMDGYAVRFADLSSIPATLKVTGASRAGEPFNASVNNGEAVRIFTGGAVPAGADTIVIQENCSRQDDRVDILEHPTKGQFIRKAGLDFKEGDILLSAGEVLGPARLSLAASMNHDTLPVVRRPRVAILATGDELILPGGQTRPGQIIASNSFGLAALVESHGGDAVDLGIAPDTEAGLRKKIEEAEQGTADIIITVGGASVGDHDLVLPVASQAGYHFELAKIAMRPGKPFLFGKKQDGGRTIRLAGLAGNPVSSLVAGLVFVRPLIRRLAGFPDATSKPVIARLGTDLAANDEREDYLRVTLERTEDQWVASPFVKQDSSMLANLARSDALLIRPPHAKAAKTGDPCEIILLRGGD